jgi:hypothetical protein
MVLCGYGDGEHFDDCLDEHETEKLKCGHVTCNFCPENQGCRVCGTEQEIKEQNIAMLQDKALAEALLKNATSKSLRQCLSAWLAKVPEERDNCNKREIIPDKQEESDNCKKRGRKMEDDTTSTKPGCNDVVDLT